MEDTKLEYDDDFFLPYNEGVTLFTALIIAAPVIEAAWIMLRLSEFASKKATLFMLVCLSPYISVLLSGPIFITLGILVQDLPSLIGGSIFSGAGLVILCGVVGRDRRRWISFFTKSKADISIHLLTLCTALGFVFLVVYCHKMNIVENRYEYFGPMRVTGVESYRHTESFSPPNGGYERKTRYYISMELAWGSSWGCNQDTWCTKNITLDECTKEDSIARTDCFQQSEYGHALKDFSVFEKYNFDRDVSPDNDTDNGRFIYAYGDCDTCTPFLRSDLEEILDEALPNKLVGVIMSSFGLLMLLCLVIFHLYHLAFLKGDESVSLSGVLSYPDSTYPDTVDNTSHTSQISA